MKLDADRQKKICDNLTIGVPIKYAAPLSGITEKTYHNWIELGEKAETDENYDDIYFQFFQSTKEAKAKFIRSQLTVVINAGRDKEIKVLDKDGNVVYITIPGKWQAAGWLLERLDFNEFGRKEKIEHSGSIAAVTEYQIPDNGRDSKPNN